MLIVVGVVLFLAVYWLVATASSWFLYKLSRGYELAPTTEGAELWKHAAAAGGVAVVITFGLGLVAYFGVSVAGADSAELISWIMFGVELCVWAIFCLWLCELESLWQGFLYAVVWMFVLRLVAFLIFLPFGVGIRFFGGLSAS